MTTRREHFVDHKGVFEEEEKVHTGSDSDDTNQDGVLNVPLAGNTSFDRPPGLDDNDDEIMAAGCLVASRDDEFLNDQTSDNLRASQDSFA